MGSSKGERDMVKYIPQERDIVYIDFSPIKGHEQKGERPAIVISSKIFNQFTNMAIVCPITTNTKSFPTHYELSGLKKIRGSVLCEHIRSIDYNERNIEFIERCSDEEFNNVLELINSFFEK